MKVVKKKMKKPLILAILAAILVLLIAAIIVINIIVNANKKEEPEKEPPVVDELLGESTHNNSATAYPHIERLSMKWIEITGGDNSGNGYGFIWDDEHETHVLYKKTEETGKNEIYFPAILAEEFANTQYSDFYAVEAGDGYNMPKLYYLCSSIGTAYFDDKFSINAADETEREKELSVYGLSKADNPITVKFSYDVDGKSETPEEKTHTLVIGDQLIYGQGYYYMVDGRNYVYTSNSTYLGYALLGYKDYINPLLVSAGLASDNAFEPYLTTDYKQWKNEIYDKPNDVVQNNSTVIFEADFYTPDIEKQENGQNGYLTELNKTFALDLEEILKSKNENNKKLVEFLNTQKNGSVLIPLTFYDYSNLISFKSAEEIKSITYNISLVESIITDSGDITSAETVGTNNLIKITYVTAGDDKIRHGVIDLSSELIYEGNETAVAALRSCVVGEKITTPISITINYDQSNSHKIDGKMVIQSIIGIKDTSTGMAADKVLDGTTVTFNYYLMLDGKVQDRVHTTTMDVKADLSLEDQSVADALRGKNIDLTYNKEVSFITYYEAVAEFDSYEIKNILCSIVKKPIVSFEYVQASKRDPYYGESFYANTLENEYKLYALNASACEGVVKVLGGLFEDAASSTGLKGSSVVDINITQEKLLKYGLYANKIYFELPRYITTITSADTAEDVQDYLASLDDYAYYGTLGFTLYISDVNLEDGTRYIASDLYDIIAVISAEEADKFIFLDQTFTDYYARRNLVLTDVTNVSNLKMEFNLSDFQGVYNNRLDHQWGYVYNGKNYQEGELTPEQLKYAMKKDFIDVYQSVLSYGTETEISRFLATKVTEGTPYPELTLRQFYDGKLVEGDSLGTQYFKEFMETLFYIFYEGSLSEEEQKANPDLTSPEKCLLRMTVSLGEVKDYKYNYVYEFYRISDRRVMVKLYTTDSTTGIKTEEAEVSDFYISTFAFKKLVNMYTGILNKQDVNGDIPYVD